MILLIKLLSIFPNLNFFQIHNLILIYYYNHNILYKHREFLSKYELIKSGDKIRFYYTSSNGDVFGFIQDKFPVEFAPPMDVETQFEKSLLAPLNRIIVALGFNEVPPSLTYSVNLF